MERQKQLKHVWPEKNLGVSEKNDGNRRINVQISIKFSNLLMSALLIIRIAYRKNLPNDFGILVFHILRKIQFTHLKNILLLTSPTRSNQLSISLVIPLPGFEFRLAWTFVHLFLLVQLMQVYHLWIIKCDTKLNYSFIKNDKIKQEGIL